MIPYELLVQATGAVIKRGVIQDFDSGTWTATVLIFPSQANYYSSMPVSKAIPSGAISPGDECAVLFFDPLNSADAVVIAVYDIPTAAPSGGSGVTSLDGGSGALTGDVVLVAGSNVTLSTSGQDITIAASGGGGGVKAPVNTTGGSTSNVTISATRTNYTSLSFTISNAQTVRIIFAMDAKFTSANAGFHCNLSDNGTDVAWTAKSGNYDFIFRQTTESELHMIACDLSLSAGSHTIDIDFSAALATGTANIYWFQLSAWFSNT